MTDFGDEPGVVDAVANELNGLRFLLVVDNAERVEQLAPLVRVLGPGGRMLVTTRHGELAVGHQHIAVDQLSEEAALELVADWLRCPANSVPAEARRVVKLCGFHSFAIALNAAAVGQGLPWSAIVTALERNELDFDRHGFEEYVYQTVEEAIRISLDALSKADRTRYRELAAFFWENGVPAATILQFWDRRGKLAEHRGQKLLAFLQQRSLLRVQIAGERRDVQLHDLHLKHITRDDKKVRTPGRTLLDSWQPAQRDAWWTVDDDGYVRRTLFRHLVAARPAADVLALIAAEDEERRNAWYQARVQRGSVAGPDKADDLEDGFAGYVADLHLASQRVDDCLLDFIASSLRSLVRAVPGELLGVAVGQARWSLKRAIAHARHIADPAQQARARIALLAKVDDREEWLSETLEAVGTAEIKERRSLVEALAPTLSTPELLPVLQRLVSWAKSASTPYERNQNRPLVHFVVQRLPPDLAPQALGIMAAIGMQPISLLGLLPEPERSSRIARAIAAEDEAGDVGVAIRAMNVSLAAKYVDAGRAATLVSEALAEVQALEPGPMRHQGLLDLLLCLAPEDQSPVLDELIADAHQEPRQFSEPASQTPVPLRSRVREAVQQQDLVSIDL